MDIKITFHEISHSDPIEAHAKDKLKKIEDLLKGPEWETPKFIELWISGHKTHPHFKAEIHLKTPQFDLHSHYEKTDMYFAIDTAIDKMVKLLNRIIVINLLLSYIVARIMPISISKQLTKLSLSEIFIILWGAISILSMFFIWGYLFYHWKRQNFINKAVKVIWFMVISIGGILYFVGPIIYYLLVVELRKTVESK